MNVFVLIEKHYHPDVDGGNIIWGVYSSVEKAEVAREEIRPQVEYYLYMSGNTLVDLTEIYELSIEEFEMELQ